VRKNAACAVNVPLNIPKYTKIYEKFRKIPKETEKKLRMQRQEVRSYSELF
jgi:hypothetical protein